MRLSSILLHDGKPRFPEVGRPPGEEAPGPFLAASAALFLAFFVALATQVLFDPAESVVTRLVVLAAVCVTGLWCLQLCSTWYAYRGRRSAFEPKDASAS